MAMLRQAILRCEIPIIASSFTSIPSVIGCQRVTTITPGHRKMDRRSPQPSVSTLVEPSVIERDEPCKEKVESKTSSVNPRAKELAELQQMFHLLPVPESTTRLQDVVFVCIDCEAFEFDTKKITEIGVSVLDTRAIVNSTPNENAEGWLEKIQYAHYRIIEYHNRVNRKFVKGCEKSFNFGPTTWIRQADAKRVLTRIFHDPVNLSQAADFEHLNYDDQPEIRNVVLVGHSVRDDANYLRYVGFDLPETLNIVGRADTQTLLSTKKHPVGLQRILLSLGVVPKDLHNAGNDAAYTMQALTLIAVKESIAPGSVYRALEQLVGQKLSPAELSGSEAPERWAGTAVEPVVTKLKAEAE